jgi:formylglycine-generating enzyme
MSAAGKIGFFLAASLALACSGETTTQLPPQGQIVLYVTTDAPLPAGPGEQLAPGDPPPLFDRLLVEIYEPGATEPCDSCSREFELDRIRMREGEASMGIVPPAGVSGYVARARLYRAMCKKGGQPPALSTIDVHAALPVVSSDGIVEVTMLLRVEDVGNPLGSLRAPTVSQAGAPASSPLGTWPKAQRTPCTGTAGSAEACVPGGAFWMGHPYVELDEEGTDASESRLVVLSPFYVDLHEVTVAEYRASALATLENGVSVDPLSGPGAPPVDPGSEGAITPDDEQFFCDYSDAPLSGENSREDLALNCVSWTAANAFCNGQGKRLPSEAEYEYMASALRSDMFVWGQSEDVRCSDTVQNRGGVGYYFGIYEECRAGGGFGGPLAPGNGALDRLALAEGDVVDLMGNVSEWTRDHWNRTSELCWTGRSLLEDPECNLMSALDGDLRTTKGSSWAYPAAPAATRFGRDGATPQRGFRCVRPGN